VRDALHIAPLSASRRGPPQQRPAMASSGEIKMSAVSTARDRPGGPRSGRTPRTLRAAAPSQDPPAPPATTEPCPFQPPGTPPTPSRRSTHPLVTAESTTRKMREGTLYFGRGTSVATERTCQRTDKKPRFHHLCTPPLR